MRKKLMLVVDEHKLYGVDEADKVVLSPEDFRNTVSNSLTLGTFKAGDYFEIEVDLEGKPVRRSVDKTVAIHVPVSQRYSRKDVEAIIKKVIQMCEAGEPIIIDLLF